MKPSRVHADEIVQHTTPAVIDVSRVIYHQVETLTVMFCFVPVLARTIALIWSR